MLVMIASEKVNVKPLNHPRIQVRGQHPGIKYYTYITLQLPHCPGHDRLWESECQSSNHPLIQTRGKASC